MFLLSLRRRLLATTTTTSLTLSITFTTLRLATVKGFSFVLPHQQYSSFYTRQQQQQQQEQQYRRNFSIMATNNNNNDNNQSLFLFDFDGVVCNSCDECTVSALKTLKKLDAIETSTQPEYPPDWLFAKMREIRPAIEVGWQIPVLLSVFWEQQQQEEQQASTEHYKAMSVSEIIANYEHLVQEWLTKHKLTDKDMIDTFGGVRDQWIQDDLNSWLDINTFYPNVPKSLNNCQGKPILVTTKQQRFAIALCRHAGVSSESLPDDLIYGLGQYKNKADVIVHQMETNSVSATDTHFFEDRWPTLAKCLKDDRLEGVNLHLCAWGYVTDEELELAKAEPRVTVLQLEDFAKLVQGK